MAAFGVIILVVTSVLFCTYSLTNLSIIVSSSSVIGFIWLKSNLSLSGATKDPFCITCFPNVLLKDSCNKWVAEWYALRLLRLSISIFISTTSLILISPDFRIPWCINRSPSFFWVSVTSNTELPDTIVPWSPTCPPDSP